MIISKIEQLQQVYDFIAANEHIAFDVESTGLNTRKDKVIGIGLSNGTQSFYICHLTWDGEKLIEMVPHHACQALLLVISRQNQIITWNAAYDCKIVESYFKVSIKDALYSDGMLAFHTTQEEGVPFSHRPFSLKTVAPHFLGPDVVSEQADMKASIKANGGTPTEFYKADLEPMARYCMQDAALTYQLNEIFLKRIAMEGLSEFYFDHEVMPLYREVLIPMEQLGLPVDVDGLQDGLKSIELARQGLETKIQAAIKPLLAEFELYFLNKEYPPKRTGPFAQTAVSLLSTPFGTSLIPLTATGNYSLTQDSIEAMVPCLLKDWLQDKCYLPDNWVQKIQRELHGAAPMFNLLSKFHLKRLFFDKLRETPLSKTETGLPQCDEQFLESVASKYEWVPWLIEYNKLTKIKSAYVERLLEEHENEVWYPSFSLHRTISGRLGSDAQQFPRPLEEGQSTPLVREHNNKIRHYFKAKPGYCFTGADYESLEPKVFAHVSTDERLKNIFRQEHDFYSTIAIMTEGLTQYSADKKAPNYLGKMNKAKRQTSKAYALGVPYGLTGFKLKFELGIEQKEADQLVKNYLDAFPDLHKWMQNSSSRVYTEGQIKIETGRIRRFPRAVKIYQKYGEAILNDLDLWRKYNEEVGVYAEAKKARREFKNYLNNGNNVQIQGLAASIVNRACIQIQRRLVAANLESRICLQIHDEICCYGPESEKEQVQDIMRDVMQNNYKISVPLLAEPNSAETYGATK